MATSIFDIGSEDNPRRYRAITLALIEAWVGDVRDIDLGGLLERGFKTSESARCFHDVVEILIEKLPRQDAVAHRLVFWNMLRTLCATFEEHLTAQLPDEVVADAKAKAALASQARCSRRSAPKF